MSHSINDDRSTPYTEASTEAFNHCVAARLTALNCRPKADAAAQAELGATRRAIAAAYRSGASLHDMMTRFGLNVAAPHQAGHQGSDGSGAAASQ